jgi:DNA-binding transcriptional LysR family regulator
VGSFVAGALCEFHRQYPRIRVQVIDDSATNILLAVARGEADFGISYLGTQEPDLEFEPLFDEDFVLACRIDHPLARRRRVRWAELAQYDCVMLSPGTGNRMLVDQALSGQPRGQPRGQPHQPAWSCEVRHVPTLINLIEAGIGIGAVPRFAVPVGPQAALACVPLFDPPVLRTLGMIRRRGQPLSPAAQALHDLLALPRKTRGTRRTPRRSAKAAIAGGGRHRHAA